MCGCFGTWTGRKGEYWISEKAAGVQKDFQGGPMSDSGLDHLVLRPARLRSHFIWYPYWGLEN